MSQQGPGGREDTPDILEVERRTHRRTALVELRGELDLATTPQVTEVLDGLAPNADGVRHIVLDLRGLTFMDASGLHELIRQNEYAHQNRHNFAVVRGQKAIQRLLEMTAVEESLVMVDSALFPHYSFTRAMSHAIGLRERPFGTDMEHRAPGGESR